MKKPSFLFLLLLSGCTQPCRIGESQGILFFFPPLHSICPPPPLVIMIYFEVFYISNSYNTFWDFDILLISFTLHMYFSIEIHLQTRIEYLQKRNRSIIVTPDLLCASCGKKIGNFYNNNKLKAIYIYIYKFVYVCLINYKLIIHSHWEKKKKI